MAKKNSRNVLLTMMNQNERLSVYNHSSGNMFPTKIEANIKKVCKEKTVKRFLEKARASCDEVYECSKLLVYGTQYHNGQMVLLPGSTNANPVFGQIVKLLYSEPEKAYLMYRRSSNFYDSFADLYIVEMKPEHGVVSVNHLADYHPLGLYQICVDIERKMYTN